MKSISIVCLGSERDKDCLVYKEVPTREGGEEFFLFFSASSAVQENALRALFRDAVAISRLGAPLHYFSLFLKSFSDSIGSISVDENILEGAIVAAMIRRGEEVYLLRNRETVLLHWDGEMRCERSPNEMPGFKELEISGVSKQRNLFEKEPADCFILNRFTLLGNHTLALVPSIDFAGRNKERIRDGLFLSSSSAIEAKELQLPLERSFPAIAWQKALSKERITTWKKRFPNERRIAVWVAASAICCVLIFIAARHWAVRKNRAAERSELAALDSGIQERTDSGKETKPPARGNEAGLGFSIVESWKKTFSAPVTSSPRFCDGKIVFGCRDGNLYAFSSNGELLWRYSAGSGIGASPICEDGRVVCADYSGTLFSVSAASGKLVWKLAAGSKFVSSPVKKGAIVYGASMDGYVVAIGSDTGKQIWRKKAGTSIRATPACGSDFVIVATMDGFIVKFDKQGKIIWRIPIGGELLSSPLVVEEKDIVIIGGSDNTIHGRSISTGNSVWKFQTDSPVTGSPQLSNGKIFVGSEKGFLFAVNLDGKEIWRTNVGGSVRSKPLVDRGLVFVTTYGGELIALDEESGSIAGRYKASSKIFSSPATDGKLIFFGSNGGVFHAVSFAPRVSIASYR